MPDDYDYVMIGQDTLDRIVVYLQGCLDGGNAVEAEELLQDIKDDQEHYQPEDY